MNEREIFAGAMERATDAERAAYLDGACGNDAALRQHIDALLREHAELGSFLESPHTAVGAVAAGTVGIRSELSGTRIGPYKLLQQIGEGGMGAVYMAEQTTPVKRMVALKVIKAGMDSRQVLARFDAERQALALMDHPSIAKVLDAGRTEDSRPYFVMELVKGVPITRYCDEQHLTPRQRLELFLPVCHAVQHAHQKGIIHRDLKPSNVLIALYDGQPVPKVIDFGVAKATGPKLTDRTLYTEFGAIVGTLEYMSPEQAQLNQLDIDTRSDIYSLGVLLYELLTGTTPLQRARLKETALLEALRLIREVEPPKPSTQLSTTEELPSIAACRGMEPRKLSGLVRGELDWIVMKALEKDRNRRYETANGLAADLRRYLDDEPVQACAPTAGYRLRKFAHKYRTLLRIAGLFVLFLVVATAVSTWQAVRAVRERDRAEKSLRIARDAVDELFTQASQSPNLKAHGLDRFRKELLRNAKEFYERFIREHLDAPGVRFDLGLAYQRLGEIEGELGDTAAAEESLAKAVAILSELAGKQPDEAEYQRELAATHFALGQVRANAAQWEKAEAAFEQALTIQERQADAYPRTSEYRYVLAKTYRESGFVRHRAFRPDRAAARYEQALQVLTKLVQDDPLPKHRELLATTEMNLGSVYLTRGWFEKAEAAVKKAQVVFDSLVRGERDNDPELLQSLGRSHAILGMAYTGQAQFDKAERTQQQALAIFESLVKEHPDLLEYGSDLGRGYLELARTANQAGRPPTALVRYEKAIDILKGVMDRGNRAARVSLLKARIGHAAVSAGMGEHARATAEAELLAREQDLLAAHIYDIGCVFSRALAAVEHDGKLSPAECAQLRARYADRAMDFFRQAVAEGWHNPQAIRTDPDVEPLRVREDFRKLVAELDAIASESASARPLKNGP